jgi:hypothetical protein
MELVKAEEETLVRLCDILLPLGFLAGAAVAVEAVSSESLLDRLLGLMTMPEKLWS